jgi:hypothetical protein
MVPGSSADSSSVNSVPSLSPDQFQDKQLEQPTLHELLSRSPLSQVNLEPVQVQSPIRNVEL